VADMSTTLPEPASAAEDAPQTETYSTIPSEPKDSLSPPDGGYGWVVVAASFVVHMLVLGNIYSFGVLFPVYIDVFDAPQGSVAWVGSISAGIMTGMGAYSGAWADEYGNGLMVAIGGALVGAGFFLASFSTELWHLYLTQGVIAGIGYSLAFISGVSVVGQWFTEKRGLATGIAVAGSGLGQFALSLVTGALLSRYGWRITLRVLALIDVVGLVACSLALKRFAPCYKRGKESGAAYFRDRNFQFLYASATLSTLGLFMPYTHLPKYAEEHGVSTSAAILMLSIMGLASMVGRVVVGLLADVYGKLAMLQVCMGMGGVSTLCWMGCTTYPSMFAYGLVFGFFAGGVISLLPTVCAELYGIKKIGTVIGILYTGTAAGNLLGAPIGGFLYDGTGEYYASIAVAGIFMVLGTVLVFFVDKKRVFVEDKLQEIKTPTPLEPLTLEEGKNDPSRGDTLVSVSTADAGGSAI
jgi:MFS family permease